jgi:hypothetical protein
MTDDNNFDAIQIDQEILTYTVSDEALEAAAGTERGEMGCVGWRSITVIFRWPQLAASSFLLR